ncbi:MAG: polyphosphate kinase 2 family protein [Planctomycetaceae bacterium]|nr:polyphosphate kinase 2 family protein [Planctomycetaceae bacterium]
MMQPLVPGRQSPVNLADFDPRYVAGNWNKLTAQERIAENTAVSGELAYRLYAENRRSVLLVLQGMDTSGKDGTIRAATTGINPLDFSIAAFKQPSVEELDHDFLWRIHKATPGRGRIGIFNRSHYEDVLVVRVHKLVPRSVWRARYEAINGFERHLTANGTTVLKCFLHISKDEQRQRLEARLADPTKRWKFSKADVEERKLWDDYQQAYEDALTRCNTEYAPWHVVPADRKWYRNLVVSNLLRETLEKIDPKFPPEEEGLDKIVVA